MSKEHLDTSDPRIAAAVSELEDLIRSRYPTAAFAAAREEDPNGVYLTVTVDLDEPDDVLDLVGERLIAMEVDEGLPVYVVPVRTPERVAKLVANRTQTRRPSIREWPALR